jgi:peroxiredoxin
MQMSIARLRAQIGLFAAFMVFVAAMSVVLAGTFEKPNLREGLPGSPAVSFRLPDLNGNLTSMAALRGNVVVLCFVADSGADTEPVEMTRLVQLASEFGVGSGVKLVAIHGNTEDMTPEQRAKVEAQADHAGLRCLTLLDPTGHVARKYRIDQTPTFVIIDSTGMIRYRGGIDDPSPDAPLTATNFPQLIDLLLAERPLPGQTSAVLSKIK